MNLRRFVASLSLDAGVYLRHLELRVADLEANVASNVLVITGLRKTVDDCCREIDARQVDAAVLKTTIADLNRTIDYRNNYINNQKVISDAREKAHEREVAELRQDKESLLVANTRLEDECADLRRELRLAEQRNLVLSTSNEQLQTELAEAKAIRVYLDGELAGSATDVQLDLVPSPEVPERKPELVFDGEFEKVYQIAHLAFIDGHKWFFRDGGAEAFHAAIRDEEFNARVARREVTFASGDLMRVLLHQVSTRVGNAPLKTVSEVVRVLEILPPAPEQLTLIPEASAAS